MLAWAHLSLHVTATDSPQYTCTATASWNEIEVQILIRKGWDKVFENADWPHKSMQRQKKVGKRKGYPISCYI